MKKRVLVLAFSNLKKDARIMRQVSFLTEKYTVTVAGFDGNLSPEYDFVKIDQTPLTFLRKLVSAFFLFFGAHETAYKILHGYGEYVTALRGKKFDLVLANDIETMPLAFAIAEGQSKVFFDAHEYAPRQFEDRLYWRVFFRRFNVYLCKKYIPRVAGMSTINKSLADAYEENFGVKSVITTNAAQYYDWSPIIRNELPIRLVHHGIFTISRQPDIMIDMMKLLGSKFTLDLIFMMPGNASGKTLETFERFKEKASAVGSIKVLPALRPDDIVPTIHAHYDMGIILVPPINFNYHNGLPNKLFDCIQARLAMAVGPLKEIAYITKHYNIGVVSQEFTAQSLADAIATVSLEDLNTFKRNTDKAAREMNAEANKEILLKAIEKILS